MLSYFGRHFEHTCRGNSRLDVVALSKALRGGKCEEVMVACAIGKWLHIVRIPLPNYHEAGRGVRKSPSGFWDHGPLTAEPRARTGFHGQDVNDDDIGRQPHLRPNKALELRPNSLLLPVHRPQRIATDPSISYLPACFYHALCAGWMF